MFIIFHPNHRSESRFEAILTPYGPGQLLSKVVTESESRLQLWNGLQGDLRLEAECACERLSAVAVSPWLVACGDGLGQLRLYSAAKELQELGAVPARHGGEVLGLSFGHWKPASRLPLVLASVSVDRSAMVFEIEVRGEGGTQSQASAVA